MGWCLLDNVCNKSSYRPVARSPHRKSTRQKEKGLVIYFILKSATSKSHAKHGHFPKGRCFCYAYNTNMKHDIKRNYWFKRRRYGYGWTPVTWQGWVSVLLFLAIALLGAIVLQNAPRNTLSSELLVYMALLLISALLLICIAFKNGPSPKWRWGVKKTDDPDEDF